MGLFFKKKNDAPQASCGCGTGCAAPVESGDTGRMVKVLGGGCAKCNQLEEAAKAAMTELGLTPRGGPHHRFFPDCRLRRDDHPRSGGQQQSGVLRPSARQG